MSNSNLLIHDFAAEEKSFKQLLKEIKNKIAKGELFDTNYLSNFAKIDKQYFKVSQILKEIIDSITVENENQVISFISFMFVFIKIFGLDNTKVAIIFILKFIYTNHLLLTSYLQKFFQVFFFFKIFKIM